MQVSRSPYVPGPMGRKLRTYAMLSLAAAMIAPVPGAAAAPRSTEVLQYAPTPDAPGAERAGRRLVAGLRQLGLAPRGFEALPMVVVRGTPAQVRRARRLPGVLYHHRAGRRLELALDRSVPLVFRGPAAPVRAANGGGNGVRVAVIDTGVDGLHPHLGSRVVHNVEFALDSEWVGTESSGNGLGLPPAVVAAACPAPCNTDQHGHGTHVAGIVAGEGYGDARYEGMTPGAEIVGLAISDANSSLDWYALAGLDYVLAHPELGVRVVNNSWIVPTDRFDPTDPINQATKMLHDAGIVVVFGAGNGGEGTPPPGGPAGSSNCIDGNRTTCAISMQASAPWAISVAAGTRINGGAPEDQALASFSSRGDPRPHTVDGIDVSYVPTLTAPGTAIASTGSTGAVSLPPQQPCAERCGAPEGLFYTQLQGTSMAAPHVAGAVALLQTAAQARLGRALTPDEAKRLLTEGAAGPLMKVEDTVECSVQLSPEDVPIKFGVCDRSCLEVRPPDECGERTVPYANWEVGAGYLDVPGALRALEALG